MASLNGQTIASSYEQLLHVDRDNGGNGNTLVDVKDGDNGTTFGIKLATNKVKIIPSAANDTNAFEVSQADGTAVFTVNTSTAGASVAGTLTTSDNVSIVKSNDGGDVSLTVKNSAGAGSTDETSSIQFTTTSSGHATAAVIGARQSNYNDSASRDGELKLQASENGSLGSKLILRGSEAEFFTNVGIGGSPSNLLHLHTDNSSEGILVKSTGNTRNNLIFDANISSAADNIAFIDANWNTTNVARISMFTGTATSAKDDGRIGFATKATGESLAERMRIESDGKVGINKTSPLTKLHVVGATGDPASSGTTPTAIARFDSTFNSVLDIGQGANPYPMWIQAADRSNLAQFYNLSLQPVGGNVGVGVQSPTAAKLQVDNVASGDIGIQVTQTQAEPGVFIDQDGNNRGLKVESTGSTAGAAIFSSNMGSATTQPLVKMETENADYDQPVLQLVQAGSSNALEIVTSANAARAMEIINSDSTVTSADEIARFRFSGTTDATGGRFIAFEDTERIGMIEANSSSQVAYTVGSSDRNKKKNFEDWNESVLDELNKAKPQMFHFKKQEDSEEKNKGYIAQDLKDAFPEAYPLSTYKEEDGDKQYYGFNPSGMVVYLMKAVQELSLKITELEKKLGD
tara:strand:+ start:363 stop:2258 length:1896 start_codon:yes stop_codon:yes gene_type:complete